MTRTKTPDEIEREKIQDLITDLQNFIIYLKMNKFACNEARLDSDMETIKTPTNLIPDVVTINLKLIFKRYKVD